MNGFFPSWTDSLCTSDQRSFLWKTCSTYVTFEWCLSFMNWEPLLEKRVHHKHYIQKVISFMNYTFRSCFVKSLAWLYLTKTYWETFLFCKNFSRKEVAQAYWILDLLNRNCCCISSIHRNKLIGVSNKFKQDFVVHLCISNS